jgi:hypothetical protein
MSLVLQSAYSGGQTAAFGAFGVKKAGAIGTAIGKGMQWLGRGASVVPVAGNAAGAVLGGVGGATQALSSGEGLKGALVRGGLNAGAGLIPGGGGIAAGMGADLAANKILAPKGPPPQQMPGAMGHGPLPGMTA